MTNDTEQLDRLKQEIQLVKLREEIRFAIVNVDDVDAMKMILALVDNSSRTMMARYG